MSPIQIFLLCGAATVLVIRIYLWWCGRLLAAQTSDYDSHEAWG